MEDRVIKGFLKGSVVEILPSNARPNSGPHPQVVHADEVELMPEDDEKANVILKHFGPDVKTGSWNSKEIRKEVN